MLNYSLADGYHYDLLPKKFFDATPSERIIHSEEQWAKGGLRYVVHAYPDFSTDQAANDEVYEFWKKKVRERINDPDMQEKLAPSVKPHPFSAKRPSLEQV